MSQRSTTSRNQWISLDCHFCHTPLLGTLQEQIMLEGREHIKTCYKCLHCGYRVKNYVPRTLAGQVVDERHLPPPLPLSPEGQID